LHIALKQCLQDNNLEFAGIIVGASLARFPIIIVDQTSEHRRPA
jgi:hypothetical protein